MNAHGDSMDQCFASAVSGDLDPLQSPPPPPLAHPQLQPQRRPRGFAATNSTGSNAVTAAAVTSSGSGSGKNRKEREKEKERTKLRERHRRAITSRMLAGLRQYGNFPLPARADMNDVIAALAREAGWTVEADGTTYKQSSSAAAPIQPQQPLVAHFNSFQHSNNTASNVVVHQVRSVDKNCSLRSSADFHPSALRVDDNLSPTSLDSVAADRDGKLDKYSSPSVINSPERLDAGQLMQDGLCNKHGNGLSGITYIPIYVRLATGLLNNFCQLVDPEGIKEELRQLKSLHVDGVVVDCWWGIVEAWTPNKYEWAGYREMFSIIRESGMKLQVVMAFHENGGSDSGGIFIHLPKWILEIGKANQDIFFTDREGGKNTECLSWGVDKERVLSGRTGIEVYFDFMRSFRTEFDDLFIDGLISGVEIGLGPCGELRYPSFSERMGWQYPGIGEFQCYDKYLMQNLGNAAKIRGHSIWARGPDNAGHYNSKPCETGFFCERGDYDSYYGRFFLHWYSEVLIDHVDNVITLASYAFNETPLIVKIPAVYWWYKTSSHAPELTAGYYNPCNQDGYSRLFDVLKKHAVTMKFTISGLQDAYQDIDEAFSDPDSLNWQVLNAAWDRGLDVAGQNAQLCYDREGFFKLAEIARPRNHPDFCQLSFISIQQPSPLIQRTICPSEFDYFIKLMHCEVSSTV